MNISKASVGSATAPKVVTYDCFGVAHGNGACEAHGLRLYTYYAGTV